MALIEDDGNKGNVEGKGIASSGTNDLEAMTSRSEHYIMKVSLLGELATTISKVVPCFLP